MKTPQTTSGARRALGIFLWVIGTMSLGVLPVEAGIANTKHNLSPSSAAGNNKVAAAGGTDEICVFCHTPHGATPGVGESSALRSGLHNEVGVLHVVVEAVDADPVEAGLS